jgi:glutamate 5-kinase
VVITSGREPEKWPSVFAGQETGTWFPARARPHARQRWIAFAAASRGVLTLDPGAVNALTERHASLLAAGVTAVEGNFRTGDVVELRGEGRRLGRGIIAWDAATVRAWCAGHPPEGVRNAHALIRRDDIVLETE